jgi:hypothetical protein
VERRRRIQHLEQARLNAAARACQAARLLFEGGEIGLERYYNYSRRLLDCQLEACRSRADRLAALRAHRDRMSVFITDESLKGCLDSLSKHNISLFVSEAELWLAREE